MRRLLALALVYDGGSRSAVLAQAGSVCRPFGIGFSGSMRWVQPDWWTARRPVRLRGLIERNDASWLSLLDGPIPAVHGVVRWRLSDLAGMGDGRNIAPRSASRRSVSICARWAIGNSRHDHGIMRRTAKL